MVDCAYEDFVSAQVYIARQPIFDRQRRLAGYELLFRSGDEAGRASFDSDEDATSSVVLNTMTEFSLDHVVGQQKAWINVTRKFILDGLADALPPKRVNLELLENQDVDDGLLEGLRRLRERGFEIALDDFTHDDSSDQLLPLADFVKIDVMALGVDGAIEQLRKVGGHGITVLAEKVETHEEFAACSAAGFHLFQGYFFCKPELMRTKSIGANRLSLLQLLAALQDPDIALAKLEELIQRDVALSYRLLRYINSAFFSLRTRVDGIGRAVALLGLSNVKRWATMTVFAGIEGKPRELLNLALVRARMCELLGPELGERSGDQLFTLGLFSVVDALLDAPMHEVLATVPFPTEMVMALTAHRGAKGELLRQILRWERGEFERASGELRLQAIAEAHAAAIIWANDAAAELLGPDEGAHVAAAA
jgi:EAL and modified HD-GYP domain-containing signal transduction protein